MITCVMFSNMARRIALTDFVLLGGMVNNITIDNRQLWCLGILIWTRSGAWKLGPITMINKNFQCFSMYLITRDRALSRMLPKVIVASCVKCSQCETATLLGIIVRARRPRLGDCQALHTGQIKTYLMEEDTQPKWGKGHETPSWS